MCLRSVEYPQWDVVRGGTILGVCRSSKWEVIGAATLHGAQQVLSITNERHGNDLNRSDQMTTASKK